jgi:Flp pilus assembly protein TadB
MWSLTANHNALEQAQLIMGDVPVQTKSGSARTDLVISSPLLSPFANPIKFAGVNNAQIRNLIIRTLIWTTSLLMLPIVTGKFILIVPGLGLLLSEFMLLKRKVFNRAENFERDYPALLVALASSVRTGLDPLVALTQSEQLFSPQSQMGKELHSLRLCIERGDSEEDALASFGRSIAHPDIPLFRTAFILSRRQGASLGECMHRLARVTRQRQSFRRKVRSAVAMQKLSAVGIGGCAIVIGIIQMISNPTSISAAWHDPVGQRLLALGCGLILAGLGWMMNMARARM